MDKRILVAFNILLLAVSGYLSYRVFVKPKPDVEIVYIQLPDQRVEENLKRLGKLESNFISLQEVYYERNRRSFTDRQLADMLAIRASYSENDDVRGFFNNRIEALQGLGGPDE